ncbi:MAG: HAMP domain-containing protein [Limimaricola sp.]|uniref:sensor histidine kinase n=1 Tax=Limimaricola sp. TaxID=2211665 RepID=UPI001D59D167|nr:ATP-binding protein [Limimaricola sp.]MBI1418272.1 HAMP domain-containing protein [Limimaricola sp.]
MTVPRSLQGRLSLVLGLGLTLLWLGAVGVSSHFLLREMNEVFDAAMEETAQRVLPLAVLDVMGRDDDGLTQSVASLRNRDDFFTYVVRDRTGHVVLQSHGANPDDFPPYPGPGFVDTAKDRIYFDGAMHDTVTIALAEPMEHRRAAATKALLALGLPLALLIPLSLLGVWLAVRGAMAPLRGFRAAIGARGANDLTPIDAVALPSEVAPIASAVNRLLGRLGRTLEAERAFTANAAHELRTPVAAALAQTQRLISETGDPDARARGAQIEAAMQRLARLSEKLMQLARAEGGRLQAVQSADLGPILGHVVAELDAGKGRVRITPPDWPVRSDIDPDAFAILARNLIENALKHGQADAPVEVALEAGGGLRVTNGGPVVPAEDLARLSQPFERGQTLAGGAGLGLAIAKTIAAGSGGALHLASPAPGRDDGFEARFIPAPAATPMA